MGDQNGLIEQRLKSFQTWITVGIAFIAVFAITMMVVIGGIAFLQGRETAALRDDVQTHHGAICALRADVSQRRATSVKFLRENPEGIPGIPASQIQQSIDNYSRTILALSGVECP